MKDTTITNNPIEKCTTQITKESDIKIDMTPNEQKIFFEQELNNDQNFPSEVPIKEKIGKYGLMWPQNHANDHDAFPLLNGYANDGCPVDCGKDWTIYQIEELIKKGPHKSAKSKQATKQLRNETNEKIKFGYARVMKWKDLKSNMPKKLKISLVSKLLLIFF